ncbi:benenodin family lasso peptide [Sphingomonas sp. So64.6b]|nr:benenodin family lasso peptide [Sphingomonas sp. So64.6b]QNA83755.1 benenodin family lasso peptide [Sphingomonas sp. So64.6b]
MEREDKDIIDLGAASIETRGIVGQEPDEALGKLGTGLTDD